MGLESVFGVPFRLNSGPWRLRPLLHLERTDGTWRKRAEVRAGDFPPDDRVFWSGDAGPSGLREWAPYQFFVSEEKSWKIGSRYDRYRVPIWDGEPQCWPFGSLIVQADEVRQQEGQRAIDALWAGCRIYVSDAGGSGSLQGPWVADDQGLLSPADGVRWVFRFSLDDVPDEDLFSWHNQTLRWHQEFLLNDPPWERGQVEDQAGPRELGKWLIERLRQTAGPAVRQIDVALPDWRDWLREEIARHADPILRQVEQSRWARAGELLGLLEADEKDAEALASLPRFQALLRQAVDAEVLRQSAALRDQAWAAAIAENKALAGQNQDLRRQHQELDAARQQKQQQLDEIERELEARQQKLNAGLRDAAREMEQARQRLAGEVGRLQGVLGAVASVPVVAPAAVAPSSNGAVEGAALGGPAAFLAQRLQPALARRVGAVPPVLARELHRALLSCPWVLIPGPDWGRAYVEALGGTGRWLLAPVEATWLGFRDAWTGEVAAFWREAVADPGHVYLLAFHEVNRSLPQCWAQSWLALLDGHRDTLPSEPPLPWPPNLRVLATVAADAATLPLDESVVARWGAVARPPAGARSAAALAPGHVPAETWLSWAAWQLGRAEPASEARRIAAWLRGLGEDELDALTSAQRFRVDWPREYLAPAHHESARPSAVLAQ